MLINMTNKLTYSRGGSTKEAKVIEFTLPKDMTCHEFKVMCVRMAHAIGYHEKSVRETFGYIKETMKKKYKACFREILV